MIISKKTIIFGGIFCICLFGALPKGLAQSRKSRQTREEYIERYKHIAIDQMERYGIPASITMAQGILESDAGNSLLSQSSNNHFGIKCKKGWRGKKVYYDDDAKGECFRAYRTVEESFDDHARFLDEQPRYDSLFRYDADDYRSWARGLKACGYATAPDYAQRLIRIIEESKLYLLDRPNGDRLYAQRRREQKDPDGWFESQSSTHTAHMAGAVANDVVDVDNYCVAIRTHNGYSVFAVNGVHYTLAKENDTFKQIGKAFRISAKKLRKYNDLTDPQAEPMTGEVIYIAPKKRRWEGAEKHHICREGETAYAVGQLYGIRTESIIKMNKLHKPRNSNRLDVGSAIRIR